MEYVICGTARVAGKSYGDRLTADELAGTNVAALIEGGHIKPADPNSSPKRDRKVAEKE